MPRIGIKAISFRNLMDDLFLKRDILLFDTIIIDYEMFKLAKEFSEWYLSSEFLPDNSLNKQLKENFKFNLSNIEYLEKNGAIQLQNTSMNVSVPETSSYVDFINRFNFVTSKIFDSIDWTNVKMTEELRDFFIEYPDLLARMYCIKQSLDGFDNCIPLLYQEDAFCKSTQLNNEFVYRFILNDFPNPSSETSWEMIMDFRADTNSRAKYSKLLSWINKVKKSVGNQSEFEDEYNTLYYEYLDQLKQHKLNFKNSTLEILVNETAEIAENITRFKFSSVAKTLFGLIRSKATLTEKESQISGKELAYIHKAKQYFDQNSR